MEFFTTVKAILLVTGFAKSNMGTGEWTHRTDGGKKEAFDVGFLNLGANDIQGPDNSLFGEAVLGFAGWLAAPLVSTH